VQWLTSLEGLRAALAPPARGPKHPKQPMVTAGGRRREERGRGCHRGRRPGECGRVGLLCWGFDDKKRLRRNQRPRALDQRPRVERANRDSINRDRITPTRRGK
jgi:hypothetical protein